MFLAGFFGGRYRVLGTDLGFQCTDQLADLFRPLLQGPCLPDPAGCLQRANFVQQVIAMLRRPEK